MNFFSLSLIVAMALFIMATGQFIPPYKTGGDSAVDPTDPDVLDAADYAINVSYPPNTHSFSVISGTSQIVAGTMYNLKVAVTEESTGGCTVFNYAVWHLSDQRMNVPYQLKSATELSNESCQ
jgi:Cystatin domain